MSKKKILSKFTISCWATFIVISGRVRPTGCGLDTPAQVVSLRSCAVVEDTDFEQVWGLASEKSVHYSGRGVRKSEAQRGKMTDPWSHSHLGAALGLQSGVG